MDQKQPSCPDCDEGFPFDRRDFLRSTVAGFGATAAGLSVPLFATPPGWRPLRPVPAPPRPPSRPCTKR